MEGVAAPSGPHGYVPGNLHRVSLYLSFVSLRRFITTMSNATKFPDTKTCQFGTRSLDVIAFSFVYLFVCLLTYLLIFLHISLFSVFSVFLEQELTLSDRPDVLSLSSCRLFGTHFLTIFVDALPSLSSDT